MSEKNAGIFLSREKMPVRRAFPPRRRDKVRGPRRWRPPGRGGWRGRGRDAGANARAEGAGKTYILCKPLAVLEKRARIIVVFRRGIYTAGGKCLRPGMRALERNRAGGFRRGGALKWRHTGGRTGALRQGEALKRRYAGKLRQGEGAETEICRGPPGGGALKWRYTGASAQGRALKRGRGRHFTGPRPRWPLSRARGRITAPGTAGSLSAAGPGTAASPPRPGAAAPATGSAPGRHIPLPGRSGCPRE